MECLTECAGDSRSSRICIRPIDAEGILGIRFVPFEAANKREERVVLFAGDRATVYRDVQVNHRRPRGGTVGRVVIHWMELLLLSVECLNAPLHELIEIYRRRYFATLSLALATLNLLPLPHLDGTHILSSILGMLIVASIHEEEGGLVVDDEGEAGIESFGTRRAEGRRRRWHRAVSGTTVAVAAVCVGGGIMMQALS